MITFYIRKPINKKFDATFFCLPSEGILVMTLTLYYLKFVYRQNQYQPPVKILKRFWYNTKVGYRRKAREFKFWWKYHVCKSMVYYEAYSRDCDCVERSWSGYCKNIKQFNEMVEDMYEWAEGPMNVQIIDKKEFTPYDSTRDRVMEAFENGRGRSINL